MQFTEEGSRQEADKARQHLQPGEQVIEWANGSCESSVLGQEAKRHGILLATERRLVIFVGKMFGSYDLEEFPYTTMSSIEFSKGLLGFSA